MEWRIGEILIQKKLINWDQLREALEEQKKTHELTGEILIRKKYISPALLYKALAEQHGIPFLDLKRTRINPKAVEKIPRSIAQKYKILPLDLHGDYLILGIANPIQLWPEAELKTMAGVRSIRLALCLPSEIEEAIETYYGAPSN